MLVGKKHTVILGVTGSIAAYRACDIIRRLQDVGCAVKVIMTKEATAFIAPLTLQTLSGQRVYQDMFDVVDEAWSIHHISLADEAGVLLVAPATTNIIGKIASGIADDLLTCTAMTTKAPIVFAPAMNDAMYRNAVVQANIAKLKKLGMTFIGPARGKLACGKDAVGRLADVDDIIKAVKKILKK